MSANGRWDLTGSLKGKYFAYSEQLIMNLCVQIMVFWINPYPANV